MIEPGWLNGDDIRIFGAELKHAAQVLRLRCGDHITVFDGNGEEHEAEILSIDKHEARALRLKTCTPDVEPRIELTLLQGIPKSDKMDYIIQKAVELGVYQIVPVQMENSLSRDMESLTGKVERWNRISREAAKQSKRTRIPKVCLPVLPEEASAAFFMEAGIVLHEKETKKGLKDTLKWCTMNRYRRLSVVVGPEGGISPVEINHFEERGFRTVTLGNRVLRTETASLAALSIILYEMDG